MDHPMTVTVKLFALFRSLFPDHPDGLIILDEHPRTVSDLIDYLDLPPDEPKIIFVNHILKDLNTVLENGDVVSIFPYISGG